MTPLAYQLSIADITAHLVAVELHFTPQNKEVITLSLPCWIPGSYMVRDFAKHLHSVEAFDDSGDLPLTQLDKQSWQLSHHQKQLTVRYQVYAFDLSVRGCYLDDQLAILNPAALCLEVKGMEAAPVSLTILAPEFLDWQVATGLTPARSTQPLHCGLYQADNYQQLIDTPLMLGKLDIAEFDVCGVPHYLVLAGHEQVDLERFKTELQRICLQQQQVFADLPADLTQYWFLCWVTDSGYGGLEHHNSTLLLLTHQDLPNAERPDESTADYQNLLGLCSHEYFHTWWVKRAKPARFLPYRLNTEQYTSQLWLYEGFTSYYDDLALVRCGLLTQEQYFSALEKTINRVQLSPSEQVQSVAESSFNAWTKYYKQDENAVNAVVSYYTKGSLIALCLDALLRSKGLTLDLLMQFAWKTYGEPASGSTEQQFIQLCSDYAGKDIASRLYTWVYGNTALPLAELLPHLGLSTALRQQEHNKDLSGSKAPAYPVRAFGAAFNASSEGLKITNVPLGSVAYKAGLMAQDQLIAVNAVKATEQNFWRQLNQSQIGSVLTLHLFRKQRLVQLSMTVELAPATLTYLQLVDQEKAGQWLGVTQD
ncbi:MAG: M61 family peptidase [Gammaproteobacteria bacterium]|nr:M61 family peptidase [Gammaproteobacteria bacterium]MBU2057855.1 M61 family peptidase [Gammaproteobacteria bacterium]MBU2176710.1 M61 family peptidase [Gammaproteobacteria bacterium]MBU2247843.1 M61 family peptidase [Gammaproteobacteria bacterium]MBU2346016.1 M61 family peptidase [Gammaproteobacteria bacterium]